MSDFFENLEMITQEEDTTHNPVKAITAAQIEAEQKFSSFVGSNESRLAYINQDIEKLASKYANQYNVDIDVVRDAVVHFLRQADVVSPTSPIGGAEEKSKYKNWTVKQKSDKLGLESQDVAPPTEHAREFFQPQGEAPYSKFNDKPYKGDAKSESMSPDNDFGGEGQAFGWGDKKGPEPKIQSKPGKQAAGVGAGGPNEVGDGMVGQVPTWESDHFNGSENDMPVHIDNPNSEGGLSVLERLDEKGFPVDNKDLAMEYLMNQGLDQVQAINAYEIFMENRGMSLEEDDYSSHLGDENFLNDDNNPNTPYDDTMLFN